MTGEKKRRTPAAPDRTKRIIVGVTDIAHASSTHPPPLPAAEVVVFLRKGKRFEPSHKREGKKGVRPAVFAHFNGLAPGLYTAFAYRVDGSGEVIRLHHFLWIALHFKKVAHCLELAAAFRLAAHILGIEGEMEVVELYPQIPWDEDGEHIKGVQPGALKQDVRGDYACVFFDRNDYANRFEAVLQWSPRSLTGGTALPFMYAIGETILKPEGNNEEEVKKNAASRFFNENQFRLGMMTRDGELRRPAFSFLNKSDQTLFKFHYEHDDFEAGDDRDVDSEGFLK